MKKILSALVLFVLGYSAFPQSLKNSVATGNPEISTPLSATETISTKAAKNFKNTFKNVTDAKWYEMPDGYRANFTSKGIRCRLDYDKKGNWLHTIRYYDEKSLPLEVRRLVASSYLDYSIRSLEEIEAPRNTISYIIHLEGQTNWINIKVYNNEINELEKIKKS